MLPTRTSLGLPTESLWQSRMPSISGYPVRGKTTRPDTVSQAHSTRGHLRMSTDPGRGAHHTAHQFRQGNLALHHRARPRECIFPHRQLASSCYTLLRLHWTKKASPWEFLATLGTREHFFMISCRQKVIQKTFFQLMLRKTLELGGGGEIGNSCFRWCEVGGLPFASPFPPRIRGWLALCPKRPRHCFCSGLLLKTQYE